MATMFDLRHVCFEGRPVVGRCHGAARSAGNSIVSSHSLRPTTAPAHGFVAWVMSRAGLDAKLYRHHPLARRLPACLRALRVGSADDARELLEDRPDLLPVAVNSLLIGVTEFFRDSHVFDNLRTSVLPDLANRRPLRVWSVGCSTGEELYSVAILLAEAGLLSGSFLLGTDCRIEAVERARFAVYRDATVGTLPDTIRERYFEPAGNRWRVIEPLRQAHWEAAHLGVTVADGPWDMILWRNMAIYLNPGPAEMLWGRLSRALAPGGFLIVGKAERPPSGLELMPVCRCIYRRRGGLSPRTLHEENA
jgi:chemotaxis methyl-accepting protein methylase